ncbi:5-deoxy-glucuronate isomerase-like [Ylistrum balloti]|uniref:5-deoxy-glucuronate isomerase-like n=1 Tax=Ylistrum balloti TaxID=509963 RepID=UPI002905AB64|nr:5-deoxy-glucuronate isomerase-like [Ylistrum balloti]
MLIYNKTTFQEGYNAITELDGVHSQMHMDFGILKLSRGAVFHSKEAKERAFLLMDGSIAFKYANKKNIAMRNSLLDELPHVLQVPKGAEVTLVAHEDSELCVQKAINNTDFEAVYYAPEHIRQQRFGEGTMQDSSTRIVRTVFDAKNATFSEMVLGEVINFPGKWSSYPPHKHPQPEIYHYRFPDAPSQGFGFGQVGENVYAIAHESTMIIDPWLVHPQVAAPGYPMYYIWMIAHTEGEKFGPNSRQFVDEHAWLLDPKVKIWKDTRSKE